MAAIQAHRRAIGLVANATAPVAYWRADAGVTVTGGVVTSWQDQIGGFTATQQFAANCPTLQATGLNGRPAIRFNGTQRLDVNISQYTQTLCVIIAVKTDTATGMSLLTQSTNPYFSNGAYAMNQAAAGVAGIFQPTSGGPYYSDINTGILATSGLAMAITINSNLTNNPFSVYATSAAPVQNGAKGGQGTSCPLNALFLGNNTNSSGGLVGVISEVMLFTTIPTALELAAFRSAMATKYALAY